jgi:hypothetical protein
VETLPWSIPATVVLLAAIVAVAAALIWRSLGTDRRLSDAWAGVGLLGAGAAFGLVALALAALPYDNRTAVIDTGDSVPNALEFRTECSAAIVGAFGTEKPQRFAAFSTPGAVETEAVACPSSARGRLVLAAFFGAVGGCALVFGVRRLRRAR